MRTSLLSLFYSAILWCIALSCPVVLAKEVQLFGPYGPQLQNYDQTIASLRSGDVLVVRDINVKGSDRYFRFPIREFFGQGNTTRIYSTGDGWAIRLPKQRGMFQPRNSRTILYTNYIDHYIDAYKVLERSGLPVVPVDLERSRRTQFVIVKAMKPVFNLEEFLKETNEQLGISKVERAVMYEKLREFAKKSYQLIHVGDLRPDQIGFYEGQWYLYDYTSAHLLSPNAGANEIGRTIFDAQKNVSADHSKKKFESFDEVREMLRKNALRERHLRLDQEVTNVSFKRPLTPSSREVPSDAETLEKVTNSHSTKKFANEPSCETLPQSLLELIRSSVVEKAASSELLRK